MQKQESYIVQLEKETHFCREQLANVLAQMREVLTEKEAMSRSDGVGGFWGIINGHRGQDRPPLQVRGGQRLLDDAGEVAERRHRSRP